jgi:hypothetical protein
LKLAAILLLTEEPHVRIDTRRPIQTLAAAHHGLLDEHVDAALTIL